ncbi:hypothetical protein EII17_00090 [Clostridiales bacterium COT073_COT-073]|nr:hypothetical protein EII17_00090 [Clostridiales bacterium COT073_COT-073]
MAKGRLPTRAEKRSFSTGSVKWVICARSLERDRAKKDCGKVELKTYKSGRAVKTWLEMPATLLRNGNNGDKVAETSFPNRIK